MSDIIAFSEAEAYTHGQNMAKEYPGEQIYVHRFKSFYVCSPNEDVKLPSRIVGTFVYLGHAAAI